MKVLIAGMDGYLGWTLAMYLTNRRHDVVGVDNFSRRKNVKEIGSWSATPIRTIDERLKAFKEIHGKDIKFYEGDLREYHFVRGIVKKYKPDTIIHLGEQPCAPYSMIDMEHAVFTQTNNIVGTLNLLFAMHETSSHTHMLKLGTLGEYGTPNIDIPEGFFEIEYRGRKDMLPFPRQAGSWYHQTKVHDSHNIMFACKIWDLRSTDIMQGVVYGTRTNEMTDDRLLTRFDFDEVWGTALNRFCAQAIIGHNLTPYGLGEQTRGFIALRDSMQCLTLATENPPEKGEYRVFNQFDETYSINGLAKKVQKIGKKLGYDVKIKNPENPRVEAEKHYYNPDHEKLYKLGFKPVHPLEEELEIMFKDLEKFKDRILAKKERIMPTVYWRK
ncbi:MAG: UDP-sulfoquinovose synthase [Candidatus Bathyarchaeota archaeon]|nr:UDP-sulfoquinovose synthase [Candidatus Bathyarchaeota archaeon]MDH5734200.1 UDP-sulfoquinovose synthase [Candidatus Bathyarchaeota archaeon]